MPNVNGNDDKFRIRDLYLDAIVCYAVAPQSCERTR